MLNIVYMGTPEFAVPALESIIKAGHNVKSVFSQPDKKVGRHFELKAPPVKETALKYNIPVYQPLTFKDNDEIKKVLEDIAPDLIVVTAYGRILPKWVLDLPRLGCVNIHASLLPKYRGAGPIQWAVINGEKKTGITTMYMAQGLDTGDMLEKCEVEITENMTASELHDLLMEQSGDLILSTIKGLEEGSIVPTVQNEAETCYAPKLTKELGKIDFSKPAYEIHNLICGLNSWPYANTIIDGKVIKVISSEIVDMKSSEYGILLDEKELIISTGEKAIKLLEIVPQGSKRMTGKQYLMGKRLQKGIKL